MSWLELLSTTQNRFLIWTVGSLQYVVKFVLAGQLSLPMYHPTKNLVEISVFQAEGVQEPLWSYYLHVFWSQTLKTFFPLN